MRPYAPNKKWAACKCSHCSLPKCDRKRAQKSAARQEGRKAVESETMDSESWMTAPLISTKVDLAKAIEDATMFAFETDGQRGPQYIYLARHIGITGERLDAGHVRSSARATVLAGRDVVIDCSLVREVSLAFADEAFAKLAGDIGLTKFRECVHIWHANKSVTDTINDAASSRLGDRCCEVR